MRIRWVSEMGWFRRLDYTERGIYVYRIGRVVTAIVWMVVSILKYGGLVPPNAG